MAGSSSKNEEPRTKDKELSQDAIYKLFGVLKQRTEAKLATWIYDRLIQESLGYMIDTYIRTAFVLTNSVTQGEQAAAL